MFDPFGFSRGDDDLLRKYKENEIKNGRLAMVRLPQAASESYCREHMLQPYCCVLFAAGPWMAGNCFRSLHVESFSMRNLLMS